MPSALPLGLLGLLQEGGKGRRGLFLLLLLGLGLGEGEGGAQQQLLLVLQPPQHLPLTQPLTQQRLTFHNSTCPIRPQRYSACLKLLVLFSYAA